MRTVLARETADGFPPFRQVVHGLGLECSAEDCTTFAALEKVLSSPSPVGLVIVFLEDDVEKALDAIRNTQALVSCPVLAVGPCSDVKLLRQMQNEARDYLDQSQFRDELIRALNKLQREGAISLHRGKTIVVTSVRPGSGVTTVASALGFALGAKYPDRALLAEMGTSAPELALNLGMKTEHSLTDLLKQWQRLDRTMVDQAVYKHPKGLHVLARSQKSLTPTEIQPEVLRNVLMLFRSIYDCVIVDVGHSYSEANKMALSLADQVVVVTRVDGPSLQLSRSFLKELLRGSVALEKIQLVANREGHKRQIPQKQIQELLEVPIVEWLPDDPDSVIDSLNRSQPLIEVAPRARITKNLAQLAQRLNGLKTSELEVRKS